MESTEVLMGLETNQDPFLVLLAALNEEKGIGPTIEELKRFLSNPTLLVIDGRSIDKTIAIAKNFGAKILKQSGRGKGDAIAQGIRFSDFNGKYVAMIDADYTYPASFIPKMAKILDDNPDVGMVCGNRFDKGSYRNGMKKIFFLGNRVLASFHNFFNGVYLDDPLSGLRVIRWDILRNWRPKSLGFDIEVELNHFIESHGFKIVEVPIELRPRLGEKKLSIFDGLLILKRIILESF